MKTKTILSLILIVLSMTSCSSSKRTGFFDSYARLQPVSKTKIHFFEKLEDTDLKAYTKIYIPSVKLMTLVSDESSHDLKLQREVSSYTTAVYRKMLMKYSSNYTLVDVAQKGTMVLSIGVSLVKVPSTASRVEDIESVPLRPLENVDTHLCIEVQTTDAMTGKVLARSMQIIKDEKVNTRAKYFKFSDLQKSIDLWLNSVIIKH